MKRFLSVLACLVMAGGTISGQQTVSDFYDDPRLASVTISEPLPVSDMELFNVPLEASYDIFSRLSSYNFSSVRYARRGYGLFCERFYAGGLEVARRADGRSDYTALSGLRHISSGAVYTSGTEIPYGAVGWLCGAGEFSVRPSEAPRGGRVTLLASNRAARAGVRATLAGASGKWFYSSLLSRRWGRDAEVDGLFMDETIAAAAVERRLGGKGSITLFAMAAPTERSSRAAATREAFELTGDNLYNPAWGWCDGRQRSSRVRDNLTPTAILSLQLPFDERRKFYAAMSYTGGRERYSGLRWYDAPNPLPDYFRNMPSRTDSRTDAAMWRDGDPAVTQIDWKELVDRNILAGGEAVYVVAQDVEKLNCLQFAAGVASHPERRLRTDYGVRARMDANSYYSRAADLLGAGWIADVDQYLVDDIYYGGKSLNDARNPQRRVKQGERFGYNYMLRQTSLKAYGAISYGDRSLRLGAAAEGGDATVKREGLYEKEMFPGGSSFGSSGELRFFEYALKLSAGYTPVPKHSADINLLFAGSAPIAEDIFLSIRYCNLTAGKPVAYSTFGAEASYRYTSAVLRVKLTGYYTLTGNETEIRHYYDDISSAYSDLAMSGISKKYYGAELGAHVVFSNRLSLLAALAAGTARYASDPKMELYADVDGRTIYEGLSSPLTNYRLGGSPQTVASGELRYTGVRGWRASATVSYMGDNYIFIDPARRMHRAASYASSPEALTQMTVQERFAAAVTVGLFLSRTFYLNGKALSAMISVNNLSDERNIIYGGYEQMRLHRSGSGIDASYAPHSSKYTYSYGRTWYASVSYRF